MHKSPLTSLRDNLIVTLQDADGIRISHAGVEIKSIVEKGLWDDLFPLEGGGHVHMKLQFVLSEEERSRIRMMRESALKKKQDELLNSSIRTSQGATTACSSVASSLGFRHELSDSQRSLLQTEGVSVKEVASKVVSKPLSFCKGEKSGAESIKGIHHDQKQLTPLNRYEEISSTISAPQGVDVHLSHKELVERNESKSLPADFPTEAISSNETSLLLGGSRLDVAASNNSIPHNLGEDRGHNIQKQSQLGKSPRNVKNMISAFESGLAQDMRSPIKSPPTRSQSNKSRIELKSQHLNEGKTQITKTEQSISGRVINLFLAEELQHTPTDIRKRGEQINLFGASDRSKLSQDTGQLEELNTEKFQILGTNSSLKNKFNVVQKEVAREEEKSHQDLMRISTTETATVSWRILDEYSGGHPLSLFTGKQDSCGNPVIEESRREIQFTNLQEFNIQGASTHKLESVHYCEDNHYLFKSSGAWIFPDEARRLCVTTGGKKVMDLMGGCSTKPKVHQGNVNLSMQENMEKHSVDARTVIKADKDKKDCQKIVKSKPENSEDIETSGGPVGQAIKVAIMLGFGILVLLTRKRNYR
ncbi:uncharacterized protein LOC126714234 isoform X3 [Quercus robur]|uniref:uncharacterized protein LOC126714234 isoform X3 n=1 Tax=Quercus robur TaxID=38942 RepID=UPI00216220C3|nr:uncharacterized protein LOC126714234 isoform X3 [Quercus robur]